jgi:SAM-dependent methyltransferase
MEDLDATALGAYYALGRERDRLAEARGLPEFLRTKEILQWYLPAPPSVIADIGGGPGRYALWLAEHGHRVEHRDLVPLHVEQLRASTATLPQVSTAVGDARELDLGDASVDAVLLLGPVTICAGVRTGCVRWARHAASCDPAARVFVAAISRWARRQDGQLRLRLYERYPAIRDKLP